MDLALAVAVVVVVSFSGALADVKWFWLLVGGGLWSGSGWALRVGENKWFGVVERLEGGVIFWGWCME